MRGLNIDSYFSRIGYRGTKEISLDLLIAIHRAQVESIPYENIDVLVGKMIELDLGSIQQKLLDRRRGGYCFELNRLLFEVLIFLGFSVRPLAARVFYGVPEGVVRPRTHMVLRVECEGEVYLVDVGFGGLSLPEPLILKSGFEQNTSHGFYRLSEVNDEILVEAKIGEKWVKLYQMTLSEYLMQDFETMNWYLCSHPRSHFKGGIRLARVAEEGRYAMLDAQWSFYPKVGEIQKKRIESVEELREVLRRDFRIDFEEEREWEAVKREVQVIFGKFE